MFTVAEYKANTSKAKVTRRPSKAVKRMLNTLVETAKKAVQIREQLSSGKGPDPSKTRLSVSFVRAFYYLLMLQLQWPKVWEPINMTAVSRYQDKLHWQLEEAYNSVFEGPPDEKDRKGLVETRAVAASEMAVLLIRNVTGDITGGLGRPILEAYEHCFKQLVSLHH